MYDVEKTNIDFGVDLGQTRSEVNEDMGVSEPTSTPIEEPVAVDIQENTTGMMRKGRVVQLANKF